jgi:uncharacterized membrane protein
MVAHMDGASILDIRHTIRRESPLDLLRKRYVMGEITADEYDQKKKFLEGN